VGSVALKRRSAVGDRDRHGVARPSRAAFSQRSQARWLVVAIVWTALIAQTTGKAETFPPARGYVNDFADVLPTNIRTALDAELRTTQQHTTVEIVLVTTPSLTGLTIEAYASGLFREWGIGKRGTDNGVLVLVAPSERRVRIEVGYGLEGVLPDGLCGEIIRTAFLPAFRQGDFSSGIQTGIHRVMDVATEHRIIASPQRRQPATGRGVEPPWLLIVLFFGVFVCLGGFMLGLGLRTQSPFILLFGLGFGGPVALVTTIVPMPASALWSLRAMGLSMIALGLAAGRSKAEGDAFSWSVGGDDNTGNASASSDTSTSASSDSSGADFGGGSSGGGGASGSW
jgi:uncharacterized protein